MIYNAVISGTTLSAEKCAFQVQLLVNDQPAQTNIIFDTTADNIARILGTVAVMAWENLRGQNIRVDIDKVENEENTDEKNGEQYKITRFGNIITEDWMEI